MAINIAGNTVINDSGRFFLPSMLSETKVAMGANNIDLAAGTAFTKTITGATTFTVSNTPASGKVGSFILEVTTTVASPSITWWAGVKWAGGTAPTLAVINTPNSFAFYTHDGGTTWNGMLIGKDFFLAPIGEAVYTSEGTYSWVAPTSVTSVCIVCVGGGGADPNANSNYGGGGGGGGLEYKNNMVVVPGSSYSVVVAAANGGTSSFGGTTVRASGGGDAVLGGTGGAGGTFIGGNAGGTGGVGGSQLYGFRPAGGGGAAGYTGAGGRGGDSGQSGSLPAAGSGGGGGGGYGGEQVIYAAGGGGGVGLYGQGANGAAGTYGNRGGSGGSGGGAGISDTQPSNRGLYGGGSTGGASTGGLGAVRIIWGPGRSFPSNAA